MGNQIKKTYVVDNTFNEGILDLSDVSIKESNRSFLPDKINAPYTVLIIIPYANRPNYTYMIRAEVFPGDHMIEVVSVYFALCGTARKLTYPSHKDNPPIEEIVTTLFQEATKKDERLVVKRLPRPDTLLYSTSEACFMDKVKDIVDKEPTIRNF